MLAAATEAVSPASPSQIRRGIGWRRPLLLLAFGLGSALAVVAGPVRAQARDSVDAWLSAVRSAAANQSFSGHYVVTGEGGASSSRIVHYGPVSYTHLTLPTKRIV